MLATYPLSVEHAMQLKEKVDIFLVGTDKFATRVPANFELEDIKKLIQNNLKVEVLVNDLYHEFELPQLTNYLIDLHKIGVKSIRFSDVGIIEICNESNIKFELTYDPETLVTSYGQFDFWIKNGVNCVSVAKELFVPELKEIIANKGQMKLSMQVHGHMFMMESKRKLISNYEQHFDTSVNKDQFIVRETTRTENSILCEDKRGVTNMFSSFDFCCAKQFETIKGFDVLVINNIFHDQDWTNSVVDLWHDLISEKISSEQAYNSLSNISKINESFLNPGVKPYEQE